MFNPFSSRRDFLKTSAAAAVAVGLPIARGAHAAGSDSIRIGLIGCGGRGRGAAVNALNNGNYLATSSALAILAREASYTGQQIMWEELMESERTFALPKYDWDVAPPILPDASGHYATATPGVTTFK